MVFVWTSVTGSTKWWEWFTVKWAENPRTIKQLYLLQQSVCIVLVISTCSASTTWPGPLIFPISIFIVHRYHAHLPTEIGLFIWILCCKKVSLSDLKLLKILSKSDIHYCAWAHRNLFDYMNYVPQNNYFSANGEFCRVSYTVFQVVFSLETALSRNSMSVRACVVVNIGLKIF